MYEMRMIDLRAAVERTTRDARRVQGSHLKLSSSVGSAICLRVSVVELSTRTWYYARGTWTHGRPWSTEERMGAKDVTISGVSGLAPW